MTNISTDFAPPLKLIIPYFIIGVIFLFLSVTFLFTFDTTNLQLLDSKTLSWVHIFLLGFVMMVIFGAMAQMIPVVLEVGHVAVQLYYVVYPLLLIGTLLMAIGFIYSPALLPYGGLVVLISLVIFIGETIFTLLKVKKYNFIIVTIVIANIFLFSGIIFGMLMALGYAGTIVIDISMMLQAHVYSVLVGYVGITIIGMSMVLLPMFWISHEFSWKPVKYAVAFIAIGLIWIILSSIFLSDSLYIGHIIIVCGFFLYLYQVYTMAKVRMRMIKDIYYYSMLMAFVSLLASVVLGINYFIYSSSQILLTLGWILFLGFLTPLITGHMYKIIPFLVWFDRFSSLAGKQKIPSMTDLVPKKSPFYQLIFSATGVFFVVLGIMMENNTCFYIGVNCLVIGVFFLIRDIRFMINYEYELQNPKDTVSSIIETNDM